LLKESLALSRAAGTARDVSIVLNAVATLELYRGEYERAATIAEEGLSLAREAGDVRSIAIYTVNLALAAAVTGEYERAEMFGQEAQEMHRELGEGSGDALANILLGYVALSRNDLDRAEELCVEAVRIYRERGQIPGIDFALDVLASVAAARGELLEAARLWGVAAASREATDIPWMPEERAMIEPHIDAARTRLDEATWREEWEKGRSMTLDQAVSYALEASGERATELHDPETLERRGR
jgi:ATP/maltotriose-dependent transcriptional regulator MalT